MSTVFSYKNPIVKLNKLQSQSDLDEQMGFMFLFMGAMAGIRNPEAHDIVEQTDPIRAMEYLVLAIPNPSQCIELSRSHQRAKHRKLCRRSSCSAFPSQVSVSFL